jgi:hypothetical protein
VRRMTMAATKWARVDRAMVTEMRVVGDEEGEGDDEKDDAGRRRPAWRRWRQFGRGQWRWRWRWWWR